MVDSAKVCIERYYEIVPGLPIDASPIQIRAKRFQIKQNFNIVLNCASVCAIQHITEPIPSPGNRGGLASGRASGHKRSCSKTPMHVELERVGIGENELDEPDWGKTSNLCVAWKADDKR